MTLWFPALTPSSEVRSAGFISRWQMLMSLCSRFFFFFTGLINSPLLHKSIQQILTAHRKHKGLFRRGVKKKKKKEGLFFSSSVVTCRLSAPHRHPNYGKESLSLPPHWTAVLRAARSPRFSQGYLLRIAFHKERIDSNKGVEESKWARNVSGACITFRTKAPTLHLKASK